MGGISGRVWGLYEWASAPSSPVDVPAAPPPTPWATLDQPMTLLVMGTDATGGAGRASLRGNTDTMLLVRLQPLSNQITVLSIPRDTRVPIPGRRPFKVNAANSFGGPSLAVRTVSEYLGVSIDRHLLVNLQGLVAAVDAVGGVELTVPKRLRYHDRAGNLHIDVPKGRQHLAGEEVEGFLRFRHDDLGDIGRVQRQQAFLMELADQFMKPAHLLKLPELWHIVREHAETDLSALEALSIMRWLKTSSFTVEMTMLPGHADRIAGGWYWVARPELIAGFLENNFEVRTVERSPETPLVTVRDATGSSDLQALIKSLEEAGYKVSRVEKTEPRQESRVIAQRGDTAGAIALHSLLGTGTVVVAAIGDLASDFTMEVGQDWLK